MTQAAVYETTNAITRHYPVSGLKLDAAPSASVGAVIAAANRDVLGSFPPSQTAAVEEAYQAVLAILWEGSKKSAGIAVGKEVASAILARRVD
jgi:hypothetical protein